MIELIDLTKKFDDFTAVDHLSLRIEPEILLLDEPTAVIIVAGWFLNCFVKRKRK